MSGIQVFQTPLFLRIKKKLKNNQVKYLNEAIKNIISNPEVGLQKKGDISDIWIYKFKMVKQETLIAYQWDKKTKTLITLSVHENFYRDVKKYKQF